MLGGVGVLGMLPGSDSQGFFYRHRESVLKFSELKKNLHATYTYTYAWQPKRLLAHSSFICRSCFAVSIRLICQGKGVGCHIALVSTLGFLLPYKLQDLFLPA